MRLTGRHRQQATHPRQATHPHLRLRKTDRAEFELR